VVWRDGDRLREYRGDAHIAVWAGDGLDPIEIGLLTEPYWGLPLKSYIRSRAWNDEQLDAGIDRLRSRGLLGDDGLTGDGRTLREGIEDRTDHALRDAIAAVADDLAELDALLAPWGAAVRAAKGYPPSGPHDIGGALR
jgi:hypothetical protein